MSNEEAQKILDSMHGINFENKQEETNMQEEAIKRLEKIIEMYQVQLADLEELFGRSSKGNKLKRKLEKEIRLFNYILKKVKKEENNGQRRFKVF